MKVKNSKHERTIDMLVDRLIKSKKYDLVEKDIKYSYRGLEGQIDVMAYLRNGFKRQRFYFFEVKSTYNKKSLKRAQKQFDRYKRVHYKQYVEGYIVTMKKNRKIKLKVINGN